MSEEEVKVEAVETVTAVEDPTMAMVMHDPEAKIMTIKKLLDAGVHYGHQTRRWNPKMGKYIYGARNGIYIIDLVKTVESIEVAYAALKKIVDEGGKVLFVGTNEKHAAIIAEEAVRSGSFYINNRWLGGTLTNFKTIQTRIKKLWGLEDEENSGAWDSKPKKEVAKLRKEKEKLLHNLEGIREMRRIPQAMVIVDPDTEHNAVAEAKKLRIPVFALCDTNVNPDPVDYVVPGNDDVQKSVRLFCAVMADAICESKAGIPTVAYTKDEGEDVTMKDVIKQADKENQERLAAIRAARKEKQERFERLQAERAARRKAEGEEDHYVAKTEGDKSAAKKTRKPMPKKAAEVEAEAPVVEEAKVETPVEETKGE